MMTWTDLMMSFIIYVVGSFRSCGIFWWGKLEGTIHLPVGTYIALALTMI